MDSSYKNKKFAAIIIAVSLALVGSLMMYEQANQGSEALRRHESQYKMMPMQVQSSEKFTLEKKIKLKHNCIHDSYVVPMEKKFQEKMDKLEKKDHDYTSTPSGSSQEDSGWSPIRFHIDYQNIQSLGAGEKKFVQFKMMPAVKSYFESVFKVHKLNSVLKANPQYSSQKCNNEVNVPAQYISTGQNADMIMLINAIDDPKSNVLAYASKCTQGSLELTSKRPTLGYFFINVAHMKADMNGERWFVWIETAIHEIMHAMGFSQGQFSNFLLDKNPWSKTADGKFYYSGQHAVDYGRKHFNCPTGTRLPLENNGGAGTAGSHWERTTFGNEGMTGNDFGDAVYSGFTLKLFEGSGWYSPDMELAQPLAWQRNAGCVAMDGGCFTGKYEHSCTINQEGCSFDYTSLGKCKSDEYEEKCPFMGGFSNTVCTSGQEFYSMYTKVGGKGGQNTRCWNIQQSPQYKAACFESRCTGVKVEVNIDGQWKTCANPGDTIKGAKVTIVCPEYDRFCYAEASCPNACTGQGTCHEGKCSCYTGFSGLDCSAIQTNGSPAAPTTTTTTQPATSQPAASATAPPTKPQCANGDTYVNNPRYGEICCNSQNQCCYARQTQTPGGCSCIAGTRFDKNQQRCYY